MKQKAALITRFKVILFALLVSVTTFPPASSAQEATQESTQEATTQHRVHEMAVFFTSRGWFNCSARAEQIATFLGGDGANQIFVVNHPSENSSMIDVTLLAPVEGGYEAGSIFFSRSVPGCPAVYTITGYLEKPCAEAIAEAGNTEMFSEVAETGHYINQVNANTIVRLSPKNNHYLRVQTEIVE